ncbi:MAG: hypothetical protein Hyperionvirus2_152 [Hyperionvirus sp.]|uniref:Protein kinase domain-containing protein n=1 Tax=Hyperionvirus sp. TaxID=2487770 RepID=A0A3G5A8E4_9VIRU|nr:MAG: hypothetical protein Hyperionvirus2_152 [Hyperionvirus sp.]
MLDRIKFEEVVSEGTHYGLVWRGVYDGEEVAVKMIQLDSGIHYDQRRGKYFDGGSEIGSRVPRVYKRNLGAPFFHKEFVGRKSMDKRGFLDEVKAFKNLYRLGLGPKLFGYQVCEIHEIHYGFIVMRKMDCTVKDILVRRDLDRGEVDEIERTIERMHKKGVVHNDLKPSNIGVVLGKSGGIRKCYFLDCQKVRFGGDQFRKSVKRDWATFYRHWDKNRYDDRKN